MDTMRDPLLPPWLPAHQPCQVGDVIPAERRCVLVWLAGKHLPFCGYIRWSSTGPYWVVPLGTRALGADVVAWGDLALPGPTDAYAQWMQGDGAPAQRVEAGRMAHYGYDPPEEEREES